MQWSVGKQTFTWHDRSGGSYGEDGRWDAGTDTDTVVEGTINPVPGDVLLTLPEGERSEKNLRILTEQEMAAPDDYDSDDGDHVTIRGERYEIRDVQIYEKVIPHFEYRVRRIRPQPGIDLGEFSSAFSSAFA